MNRSYTLFWRKIRLNPDLVEPGRQSPDSRSGPYIIVLVYTDLHLISIFDYLFPLGLVVIVLGKVHHLAPLNSPDSRAGLKADLQRSTRSAS